jgi:hypothetical protein
MPPIIVARATVCRAHERRAMATAKEAARKSERSPGRYDDRSSGRREGLQRETVVCLLGQPRWWD